MTPTTYMMLTLTLRILTLETTVLFLSLTPDLSLSAVTSHARALLLLIASSIHLRAAGPAAVLSPVLSPGELLQ